MGLIGQKTHAVVILTAEGEVAHVTGPMTYSAAQRHRARVGALALILELAQAQRYRAQAKASA